MTFAQEVKQWRGNMLQKNACDVIGVSLPTIKAWEQGINEPCDLTKAEARWRMAAFKQGINVEVYRARYFSIICQVAGRILPNKS